MGLKVIDIKTESGEAFHGKHIVEITHSGSLGTTKKWFLA